MKYIKKIFFFTFIFNFILSCTEGDNIIYEVLDAESGAILRTIEIQNDQLNSSDPASQFSVTVQEQDEKNGELLQEVEVYVSLKDLDPDNGITVAADKYVKTYLASDFTSGEFGLPQATISVTFEDALAALGIGMSDFSPGDLFIFDLKLKLTDGRIFDYTSTSGQIASGFYNSSFRYNTLITCTPQPGDYLVVMHDSYGDGWQTNTGNGGNGIQVDVDGVIIEVGMCSPYEPVPYDCVPWPSNITDPTSEYTDAEAIVTIPVGTESMTWTFPGDRYGEISFEIYSPDGTLLFEGEAGTPAGLLPITNCL